MTISNIVCQPLQNEVGEHQKISYAMSEYDSQVAVKALRKYQAKDKLLARDYRSKQQAFEKTQFFLRQSDYYKLLINTIMNKTFDAKILAVKNLPKGRFLHFLNMNTGTEDWMPEVSIINYVELPSDVVDAWGHVLKDAIVKLREKEKGLYYPAFCYPKKANPTSKAIVAKKMNKETLYEDAELYQAMTLPELWKQFAYECAQMQIAEDAVLTAISMKGVASESVQYDYLCKILNIDTVDIGMQENRSREYKSSFLHCANPLRSERSSQFQAIFKEIVAFGNSHIEGNVFVGIANDGSICGVEEELLNEACFANRSDFQADFRNQMNQAIGNYTFISTIKMKWYKTNDAKLFCRIFIPKWDGDVLFMNGCELYVREDAGKRQLKNADLINYILSHSLRKEVA